MNAKEREGGRKEVCGESSPLLNYGHKNERGETRICSQ